MPDPDVDRSIWKVSFFGALAVLAAFLFGYTAQHARLSPSPGSFLWATVGLCFWLSFSLLIPYIVKSASIAALIAVLQSVIVALFLFGITAPLAFFGSVLFLALFLLSAFRTGRSEIQNAVRIKFFTVGRGIAAVLVLGVTLFLAFVIVFALRGDGFKLPRPLLSALVRSSTPVVQYYVPNFSEGMKVNDVLEAFARKQAPEGTPQFAIDQTVADLKAGLEKQTKTAINPDARVMDTLDTIVNTKLRDFSARNQTLTFVVLAGLIFFTLAGLGFFLKWAILILAFLVFQLLYVSRFLHTEFEQRDKEVIIV